MLLEFTKAVAEPAAIFFAAYAAARVAANAYKRQKLFERRSQWYEGLVARLVSLQDAYATAVVNQAKTVNAQDELNDALRDVALGMHLVSRGSFDALRAWYKVAESSDFDAQHPITSQLQYRLKTANEDLFAAIVMELRRDYSIPHTHRWYENLWERLRRRDDEGES